MNYVLNHSSKICLRVR